ncbi:DNA excision repair protein ERCC-6-like [Acipenser oxyrinchus oxyrinchus]|uniref:DNA excision repair protein ERCC-6-like n=1 Tax=Acipenser oxyrinchus oxyrinchus TaxID=40147 RepID=A0AAD8D400_ACIOX|nr:DNA excision repair protein ERCC-6-like [Acipenser oxyrinchus oxyrinchus]
MDFKSVEKYQRYVKEGKDEARNGNLSRSLELFNSAYKIHPSEKLKSRIQKLEEAVAELARQEGGSEEDDDDEFVDVNGSGLMLFRELHDKLYEHQKEGIAFLYGLHRDGRKGGILADDMGLGKTIQIIAFLSGMFDAELVKCALIVMPTTLIANWTKEFAKWTPGMRIKEFHGTSKAERVKNLEKVQRRGGVIITTYQMLINNWQLLSSFNDREFTWDYIILDEAHKIKTSSTKTAKSAHAIPARNRILLTGTPVQNNLREMWALFDFACQGTLLGTAKTFKMEYESPITRAREKDATTGEKALGLKISENLMTIIDPYFLRRTKQDVQKAKLLKEGKVNELDSEDKENKNPSTGVEMPSLTRKNDLIIWTYLSPVQEDIYNKFISLDQIKEILMTNRSPLAELTVLKKLCDHPRLLSARACGQLGLEDGDHHSGDGFDENDTAAGKIDHLSDDTLINESGKLTFLVGLLERLRDEGNRTLVFSQSRKMLDILSRILVNRGFKLLRIDGTITDLSERQRRIILFQNSKEYSVFLLTTQVGGVGITLTSANRVVIFDPSWNPATDAQAVDRAYRIGQTENVVIYRLITCGTVEEKIYRRQVFKDSLIRQTTGDKKNPFRYFSKQELKELFKLEDTRSSSTQIQLQSLHATQRRTDPELDEHIAYLYSLEMFGLSDHDLMFSSEAAGHEDHPEDTEAQHYIEHRVLKAQELMKVESELHQQLMENIKSGTEPAWLHNPEPPKRSLESKRVKTETNVPTPKWTEDSAVSPPAVVDLTQESIEQNEDIHNVSNKINNFVLDDSCEESEKNSSKESCLTVGNKRESEASEHSENKVLEDQFHSEDSSKSSAKVSSPACGADINYSSECELVADVAEEVVILPGPQNKSVKDVNFQNFEISPALSVMEGGDIQILSPCPNKSNLECPAAGLPGSYLGEDSDFEEDIVSKSNSLSVSHPQCDFKLQLQDSAEEMFENNSSVHTELNSDLQLCMESSSSSLKELPPNDDPKIISTAGNSPQRGLFISQSEDENMAEGSFIHTARKKNKARVISDSDDEDDESSTCSAGKHNHVEGFSSVGSPLHQSFLGVNASTPKQNNYVLHSSASLTPHRKSIGGNTSVASRKSFVSAVVEDIEDMEESDDKESEEESSMEEEVEANGEESVLSEGEPTGETLNTEDGTEEEPTGESLNTEEEGTEEEPTGESLNTEEEGMYEEEKETEEEPTGESVNTEEGQEEYDDTNGFEMEEGEESTQDESTGDIELRSDENMDCCTIEKDPPRNRDTTNTSPSAEDKYEYLVKCGKGLYGEGNFKEALDVFLQALDLKSGDPEIQLMTIRLYRQLSKS